MTWMQPPIPHPTPNPDWQDLMDDDAAEMYRAIESGAIFETFLSKLDGGIPAVDAGGFTAVPPDPAGPPLGRVHLLPKLDGQDSSAVEPARADEPPQRVPPVPIFAHSHTKASLAGTGAREPGSLGSNLKGPE